ncbi:ATP synthase peripheral stalk subunit OSCP, mitochondrial-like [Babylonia areolata]|uniref:ATP synthase peripheral stalk subunit OSCP, mitochondrial-like n=1 Tax=Babylonia areolata TaxID=304850 RepID=UPI003FD46CF0
MASFRFSQVVRQFTTSAVQHGKLVNTPIQVFGIEGRYATALFSAASKQKKLDAVEKEMNSLSNLLQKDKKLADFVANPSLKRVEKKAVLEDVLKKQKYSDLTVNLVAAMADNGRIAKIKGVLSTFAQLMSAHRGEVVCTVKTAKALDKASLNDLKTALEGFLKKGETLQLATEVDPSLIGGMVVSIGDKYVDMSMATKIKNYTTLIKQAV